jgi:hypothetical protein
MHFALYIYERKLKKSIPQSGVKGGKINEEEMVCDGVSDVGPYGLR